MRFRTSCFNPTLLQQNLRRFWPLPVGIFAYYFLSVVMPFWEIQDWTPVNEAMFSQVVQSSIYNDSQLASVAMVAFAALTAALMFRHIHARKDTQFYLGLPMTRKCLYITNLISGYLMLVVPVILNMLILGITTMIWGFGFLSLPMLGCILSAATCFYAMAVLACVLGGQTFGAFLIYVGLNCALILLAAASGEIIQWLLPGWGGSNPFYDIVTKLTPVAQYTEMHAYQPTESGVYAFREGWVLPVYTVAGVVLMVLGGWLYQIRKSETAGDMVSFRPVRILCKVFVSLIAGTVLTLLVMSSIHTEQDFTLITVLLPVLLFTIVGWIAAEMVIQKSFRIFNRREVLGCGILLAAIVALGLGLNAGGFGYVTRTPDAEDIKTVRVHNIEVTAEDALELHHWIIDHQEDLCNGTGSAAPYSYLNIDYELRDGGAFSRSYYYIAASSIDQELERLLAKPDYVYQSWFSDLEGQEPNDGYLYFYEEYNEVTRENQRYFMRDGQEIYANISISTAEVTALYDAVCKDIAEGNLPSRYYTEYSSNEQNAIGEIYFERIEEQKVITSGTPTAETVAGCYITLDPSMTHTMNALREMGFEYIG